MPKWIFLIQNTASMLPIHHMSCPFTLHGSCSNFFVVDNLTLELDMVKYIISQMIIHLKWLTWKKQRFLHLWITPFEAAMCLFTWQEKLVVSVSSFTSCSNKMRKITPSLEISFKSFGAIKSVWNASPFLRPGVLIWKPVLSEKLKPYIS